MQRHVLFLTGFFTLVGTASATESGVSPQVVYKPSGPASVAGLGESFQPDLHTGMAAYEVKLTVPPGVHGHQPELALIYNSGQGQGVFGLGWGLNLTFIQRQTDKGLPSYTDQDTFIYSNNEELVRVADGTFRLKNEGLFARFRRMSGDSWEVTAKSGIRFLYGQSAAARLSNPEGTFRWYLEEIIDSTGNRILYQYLPPDGGQVYLKEVRYNLSSETVFNSVEWMYQDRPDPFTDYRSRYPVLTRKRCQEIQVKSQGRIIRTYRLEYEPLDPAHGRIFSLLKRVTLIGRDGVSSLPPVTFGYTIATDELPAAAPMVNSPNLPLADGVEVTDFYGEGLPGLLRTTLTGHVYIRNLGGGQWANPTPIPNGPPDGLQQSGVLLADFNGDGFSDLVVQRIGGYYYYPNRGRGQWEAPVVFTDQPEYVFSSESLRLIDINFDKLPDVCVSNVSGNLSCWVNRGEGAWGAPVTVGLPLGISFTSSRVHLADMNGDGMLDLVSVTSFGVSYYPMRGLNSLGGSPQQIFDAQVTTDAPGFPSLDEQPKLADLNGDGLADLVLVKPREVHYWLNLGHGQFGSEQVITGTPNSTATLRLVDIYGRGSTGILWYQVSSPNYVYLDVTRGVKPNLLQTIDNGLGRRIRLDYQMSTEYYLAARDRGFPWVRGVHAPVPVVSQVTVTDLNSQHEYVSKFDYRNGYYSGLDRQFRGFEKVVQIDCGEETAPTKVAVHTFDVGIEEESRKAKIRQLELVVPDNPARCDSQMWLDSTGLFTQETFDYSTRTLYDGSPAVRVSLNTLKNTYVYEATATSTNLREAFDFDNYGNVTEHSNYGRVAGNDLGAGNDELRTFTEYGYNEIDWIVDRPIHITKTALDAANVVAEEKLFYDGPDWIGLPYGQVTRGNLVRQEQRLGPNGSGGAPCPDAPASRCINTVRNQYDAYGNVVGIMDASGNPARLDQGHYRTLLYDAQFHTFPEEEQIHLEGRGSLVASALYDPGFGTLTDYLDFNQQLTQFHFDELGRVDKVIKPGDTDLKPTLKYTYYFSSPVSYVETNQRQRSGQDDTIDSREYLDGLGRKLQTKLRAEDGQIVVQDATTFNQRTTIKERYFPYFDIENTFEYRAAQVSQRKISISYDALGRDIQTTQPDGSFSQIVYEPLQKTLFDEENTDATSIHYNAAKTFIQDGLGRLVEVIERNGGETHSTTYGYDPLGKLTQITDADGNPSSFIYDWLSRQVQANEPDRLGATLFTYFDTRALKARTDAKLQTVSYSYDGANRLKTEIFLIPGRDPQTHATYHYDSERPVGLPSEHPTIANTQGRLVYVDDLSGQSVFSYDARGRISVNTRKAGDSARFYTTRFTHDAADRLSALIFPDPNLSPEQRFRISYQYNKRGLLSSIPGFAEQITYEASGQTGSVLYGNGVTTSKSYDLRNRLDILTTISTAETPNVIQDLKYDYDRTSNVLAITDRRGGVSGEMKSTECFAYDDLHRLVRVDGRCQEHAYYTDFAYSPSGNLTSKASDRPDVSIGSLGYGQQAGPHAVTTAGARRFHYDANGNLSGEDGAADYQWDPLDRLVSVVKYAGPTTEFTYDYTGARVTKRAQGEEVFYVNQYSEVRNGQLIKYIYAGNHRVAEMDDRGQVSFNHFDHLGSSSIVSNASARITGRTEYYAFGQERLRSGTFRLPYTYTDKERDESTGLGYFSARYHASELGRFISTDPKPVHEGMLSNPQDLNPYSYALNNPILHVDPDGQSATLAGALIGGLVGGGVALFQGKSWAEVGAAAAGGALAGAMLGSVIDTGGASLGVMIVAGGISGAAGGTLERTILGKPTTVQNLAVDALAGTAGVAAGAVAGKAVNAGVAAVEQRVVSSTGIGAKGGTEIVERAMSRAELAATRDTGLVRGGRAGMHFVSDAVNSSATRAQQRLALPTRPEVRAKLEVPAGRFSVPSRVAPLDLGGGRILPGGGMERSATGPIPARIVGVDDL